MSLSSIEIGSVRRTILKNSHYIRRIIIIETELRRTTFADQLLHRREFDKPQIAYGLRIVQNETER